MKERIEKAESKVAGYAQSAGAYFRRCLQLGAVILDDRDGKVCRGEFQSTLKTHRMRSPMGQRGDG